MFLKKILTTENSQLVCRPVVFAFHFSRLGRWAIAAVLCCAALSGASRAIAEEKGPRSSSDLLPLQPAESTLLKPEPPAPAPFRAVPKSDAANSPRLETRLDRIGLLKHISTRQMTVKSLDGGNETFSLSPQMQSLPRLNRGALVSYRISNNRVAELKRPVVSNVFEGALIVVEEGVLGLLSVAGERKYTRLDAETMRSLKLKLGQVVRVYEFEGIQTKVFVLPDREGDRRYLSIDVTNS